MYRWLNGELLRFGDELPETYKGAWKGSIAPPSVIVEPTLPGASATNYFTNTASYSPAEAIMRAAKIELSTDGDTFVISTD
jgi:hypothetical protein